MVVKGVVDEDFVNYKQPSMFIAASSCTFKCEKESGVRCCQNSGLAKQKSMDLNTNILIERYLRNPITSAVVFGGLEPFDQFFEVFEFISKLRVAYHCNDTVVIYTGYDKTEVSHRMKYFKEYPNIIVKFGRYVPDCEPHYDEVLGVNLASPNQYAEVIS